ncbi:unnamed protein product [Fraxinus pennsylvanica]|uniref:Uncharacterized protein n=1 Tax=Fraxinus pennsylvanica TaxID=56036 RepID=A0AAD2A1Q7_9LAMI|nr:unnamed protein product [Fraxinus pennsylvanica]
MPRQSKNKYTFKDMWMMDPFPTNMASSGSQATRLKPAIQDSAKLERQGLGFALTLSQKFPSSQPLDSGGSGLLIEKPVYALHATAGVVMAASIAVFAYWYGRKRRRW